MQDVNLQSTASGGPGHLELQPAEIANSTHPVLTTRSRYAIFGSRYRYGWLTLLLSMQSTGLAGTALEQSKRPIPFIISESGTGYLDASAADTSINIKITS